MTDDQLDAALGGEDPTAKVFISYSRKDRERAQRISDALRARSFGVFRDTEDILPTEEWQERLEQLIYEADTIVFLLSPHMTMPNFALTDQQIDDLIAYIHSLR